MIYSNGNIGISMSIAEVPRQYSLAAVDAAGAVPLRGDSRGSRRSISQGPITLSPLIHNNSVLPV